MTPLALIAWRQRLGFNKAEASRQLGMSKVTLDAYESGKNKIPRYVALACAALAMGVPPIA